MAQRRRDVAVGGGGPQGRLRLRPPHLGVDSPYSYPVEPAPTPFYTRLPISQGDTDGPLFGYGTGSKASSGFPHCHRGLLHHQFLQGSKKVVATIFKIYYA